MAENTSGTKRYDSRIPWLIVVPFLLITLIWAWGFNTFKFEERTKGEFPVARGVETIKIVTDVGNVDVMIGAAGKITFEATTLRATGSQEQLDLAIASPFTFETVGSTDPAVMIIRVSPIPEGFVRLPQLPGSEKDQVSPRLFRQLNARITVPVELGVILESSQGNIRLDTRQAPTSVTVGSGNLMLMHVASSLTVENGGGDTIIDGHRGPLNVEANGKTRVSLADVSGPIHIVNETGEIGLYMPKHSSVELDARSLTGGVRNVFGFKSASVGAEGQGVKGKIGAGEHRVHVVAKAGSITVARAR